MKREDRIKKEAIQIKDRIRIIVRHIKNVQDNCILLGEKLIDRGEFDLGRMLIMCGLKHDLSKFMATEWDNLDHYKGDKKDAIKLKLAITQHNRTNTHHPEYMGSIHKMSDLDLAELLCDWKSRSEEFGTALVEWINNIATERFKFTKSDPVYFKLMDYVNLLCEKPIEQITDDIIK